MGRLRQRRALRVRARAVPRRLGEIGLPPGGRPPLQAVHLPLHDATRRSQPLAGDGDRWPCPRHRAALGLADRGPRGTGGPRLRVPPAMAVQDRRRRARGRRRRRRAARLLPPRRARRVGRADHPRLLARAAAGEHRRGARTRRRRRQYDATGEIQRESLAETAEILRAQRHRHRAAGRAAADRARAHRAPDRGHAPLACSTTSGTSPRCWTASTTRASARRAGARCSTSCARC